MAQRTGTNILALARIFAQDNDASGNYSTIASEALILLNDVLMRWTTNVRAKPKYLAATTTGLTFTSGTVYKETSDNTDSSRRISAFESFHPANTDSLAFPLPDALEVRTVDEIRAMLRYDGDTALSAQANEWTHVAFEKTQDATSSGAEKWRVWAYPVINRTRYLTVKAAVYTQLAAISDIPDIEESDANTVARFLAWEMMRLKKELPISQADAVLAPVDPVIVRQMNGGALYAAQLQDTVDWRDW